MISLTFVAFSEYIYEFYESKGGLISERFSFCSNPQIWVPNHYPERFFFRWIVLSMAFPVVEFSRQGYKIRKVFG